MLAADKTTVEREQHLPPKVEGKDRNKMKRRSCCESIPPTVLGLALGLAGLGRSYITAFVAMSTVSFVLFGRNAHQLLHQLSLSSTPLDLAVAPSVKRCTYLDRKRERGSAIQIHLLCPTVPFWWIDPRIYQRLNAGETKLHKHQQPTPVV